jgi:hypothetical protein
MTFRDAELRYRPEGAGWLGSSTDSRSRLEFSIVYANPRRANTAAPDLLDGKGRKRLVLKRLGISLDDLSSR